MKNTKRTFKTVLAEKAKLVGCKTPSQYKAFFEACAFCYEKGYNKKTTFSEWIEEESFFD